MNNGDATVLCSKNDLIEDVDVVVGQVQEDEAAEAAESPLLHPADVAALQRQVSQVGRVSESPAGQFLDVVTAQIQFYGYLEGNRGDVCHG